MLIDSLKDTIRDLRLPHPPFWLVSIAIVGVVATWVPLAYVAKSRSSRSSLPPIHLLQDMDNQPKFQDQQPSPVFADGRSMRPPIPGTIARGDILDNEHYTRGYTVDPHGGPDGAPAARYFAEFPPEVTVDAALLDRGQRQYNIMCSHCHGFDGRGKGLVNERAMALVSSSALIGDTMPKTEWAQVANFTEVLAEGESKGKLRFGAELYPHGKVFNTITHGFGNMGPLGSQVSIGDRWAIVAYVRALQAVGGDMPAEAGTPGDQVSSGDAAP